MNKFLTKIATFGLGMIMAIGVGVAAANSEFTRVSAAESSDWISLATGKGASGSGKAFTISDSNGVSLTFSKGYGTGTQIRNYANGTTTLSYDSTKVIVESVTMQVGDGKLGGTWTNAKLSGSTVTFNSCASGTKVANSEQARILGISVNYNIVGSSESEPPTSSEEPETPVTPESGSKTFKKYTDNITSGNYLVTYQNGAMQASISSSRFQYATVAPSNETIKDPNADLIWSIQQNGSYWTLYNESTSKYAGGTGTKNQGKLLESITDYAKWTVSGASNYEFVNLGNKSKGVNANLRKNDTYGFACYATGTGGALTLYKEVEVANYSITTNIKNGKSTGATQISAEGNATLTITADEGYILPANVTVVNADYTWNSSTGELLLSNPTGNVTITAECKKINVNFNINCNITNGSSSGPITIAQGGYATIVITADDDYKLPGNVTVVNAEHIWNSSTGELILSNATGDVSISADCIQLEIFNITVLTENCVFEGPQTVKENSTVSLTFTADAGFSLPSQITTNLDDNDFTWDRDSGIFTVKKATKDIEVTVVASTYSNSTDLSAGNYFIKMNNKYLSAVSGGTGTLSDSQSAAIIFTFSLVGDDLWIIECNNKYLTIGNSSTSLSLGDNSFNLTIEWDNEEQNTRKIHVKGDRALAYYPQGNQIRTYDATVNYDFGVELEKAKTIENFYINSTDANFDVLKGTTFTAETATEKGFTAFISYVGEQTPEDVTNQCTWELDTSEINSNAVLTVTYGTLEPITIEGLNIYSIEIVTLELDLTDVKTDYSEGEKLDVSNLKVTGIDTRGDSHTIELSKLIFNPSLDQKLSLTDNIITVSYVNEDYETTASTSYEIIVAVFDGYTLVTDISELSSGDRIIIVAKNESVALSTTQNTNNRAPVSVNKTDNGIEHNDAMEIITLVEGFSEGTFGFEVEPGRYLHSGTGDNNHLKTTTTLDDYSSWNISINSDVATIKTNTEGNRNWLRYNTNNNIFSCYGSGQTDVCIYKASTNYVLKNYVDEYLRFNTIDLDADTTMDCKNSGYYQQAKEAYLALDEDAKTSFVTEDEYENARLRLAAWAKANNEEFDPTTHQFHSTLKLAILGIDSSNPESITLLIVTALIALSTVAVIYFKKREQNAR